MKLIVNDEHKVDPQLILNDLFFENVCELLLAAAADMISWSEPIVEHYKAYINLYTTLVRSRDEAIKQTQQKEKPKKGLDFWDELLM